MGDRLFAFAFDQFENRTIARCVVIHLQTFAGQLGDNFLNRCRFVELDQLGAATDAVGFRRRSLSVAQRQQFLLHLGVKQIEIEVRLVKFPDRFLVVKIMNGLVVTLPHFHQIGRELARLGVPVFEISLEIAAMPSDDFA